MKQDEENSIDLDNRRREKMKIHLSGGWQHWIWAVVDTAGAKRPVRASVAPINDTRSGESPVQERTQQGRKSVGTVRASLIPAIGFELPQLTVSRVLVRNTCRR